jgi:hypothetical protein
MSARNMGICVWCRNKTVDVCLALCQPEGRYRYLEPETLADWESIPELPPFPELLDLPASERLALVYLSLYYRQQKDTALP